MTKNQKRFSVLGNMCLSMTFNVFVACGITGGAMSAMNLKNPHAALTADQQNKAKVAMVVGPVVAIAGVAGLGFVRYKRKPEGS